jgi:hypothetical protein
VGVGLLFWALVGGFVQVLYWGWVGYQFELPHAFGVDGADDALAFAASDRFVF